MKRWLMVAGLLAGLCGPWTSASAIDALSSADASAIDRVVRTQMEALINDDASGAFELTTQQRRHMIGSPDKFLRLMKEEFNPLYRHQGAVFSSPEVRDGDAVQLVRVVDAVGRVWLALFRMMQEPDGSWKVDDCELLGTRSLSV